MILPDANLLLYAVDETSPFHTKAKTWLEKLLNGKEEVGFCPPVIFAFTRLSTHRRIFSSPLRVEEAFQYVERWIQQPMSMFLLPSSSHVQDVKTLLLLADSSGGNLVTDAQIAAYAEAYKATIHTTDRDFLRFKTVTSRFPLDHS